MVLEAVMVVVDNSESSRNGDYTPTRFEAQADAVSMVFSAVTQGNPESSVGLMSMGGKGPEVLVTLTTDHGKILEGLHRTKSKISGTSHLATGLQIAGLALKHRQNNTQRMRIIVFTCSPIAEDEKSLVKLAKKMKKHAVSIDFIAFGDIDDDVTKKLTAFNENVKSGEGSHLTIIPPGPGLLSDQLIASPILNGDGSGGGGAGGGGEGGAGGGGFEFGFDPSAGPRARGSGAPREPEAQKNEAMPGISEENEESKPLLDNNGEASGSGDKDDDKKDDSDKMDTT
ncbi:hypothetical protein VE04_07438 [Pseudogymnoascus sp. 24MN13]|nr:hypothetical protein VE04_07438 [Pseudogymnoascus sp. 24MN13]